MMSRDGTVRWLADRAKARHTPDGAIIADSITIDVTEHRRVTDELRRRGSALERIAAEGEQRLEGLLAAADAGSPCSTWSDRPGRCGSPTRPWRSGCSARRCRPGSISAPPSSARSRPTSESAWCARSRPTTGSASTRACAGWTASSAASRSRAPSTARSRETAAASVFVVVREIARDPRIAALLDAVDEPVYELELGADGVWRTTAGIGIRGCSASTAPTSGCWRPRCSTRTGRRSRPIACGSPPGRRPAIEFRVRTAGGAVRWLWERAQGRREGDRVIAVAAVADVTAWHPAADDRVQT